MNSAAYNDAVKELLYKMADDQMIIGHRYSEWTGIGPVIEEDIAFGSLAQDKVGHAFNLYQILHTELGEANPDQLTFARPEGQLHCSHLAELSATEYDISLVRHFLFDHAEFLRFEMLSNSSFMPLSNMARKYKAEIKYHTFHADTWIKQLAIANEESKARIQSAFNSLYPIAQGIFEAGPNEDLLISEGIFAGEAALKDKWIQKVTELTTSFGLTLPSVSNDEGKGGRYGYHTDHLAPLLKEMSEVFETAPNEEW